MAPTESKVDVLVIGAGPAGVMCANGLARAGVNVRIIDKRFQRVAQASLTHRFRVPAHPFGNVEHSVRPIELLDRILSVAECSHHLIRLPAHIIALSGRDREREDYIPIPVDDLLQTTVLCAGCTASQTCFTSTVMSDLPDEVHIALFHG